MIHWLDSFMAIFGYKRPEVWEAERKEHDVTFPAPQAFPADMKPRNRANEDVIPKEALAKLKSLGVDMSVVSNTSLSFSDRMKELSKASVRSKKAGKRSQSAEGSANVRSKKAGKRSQSAEGSNEPLTYVQIQGNGVLCHQVHVLWQSGGTDAEIAQIVGATTAAVKELRRRKGWVRDADARIAARDAVRQLHKVKANVRSKRANVRSKQAKKAKSQLQSTNKEE